MTVLLMRDAGAGCRSNQMTVSTGPTAGKGTRRLGLVPATVHDGGDRMGLAIPQHNDFAEDELHAVINNRWPGHLVFDPFAWSPGAALFSGTIGLLGKKRHGLSPGIACPLAGRAFVLEVPTDVSGLIALADSGAAHSTPSRWR